MPKKTDRLELYRKKRDFEQTPEPSGPQRKKLLAKFPTFVIQKHDATRLHYDFRLEDEGVLKSWAVPKGPSLDPKVKRLAMPTEDHPMDYGGFEGVIPEGNYGAGPVIVWDNGHFINVSEKHGRVIPLSQALEEGHARIWMEGKKVRGGFTLARMGRDENGKTPWLLVKHKDEASDPKMDLTVKKPKSVISGKTIEEMAKSKKPRTWKSDRGSA